MFDRAAVFTRPLLIGVFHCFPLALIDSLWPPPRLLFFATVWNPPRTGDDVSRSGDVTCFRRVTVVNGARVCCVSSVARSMEARGAFIFQGHLRTAEIDLSYVRWGFRVSPVARLLVYVRNGCEIRVQRAVLRRNTYMRHDPSFLSPSNGIANMSKHAAESMGVSCRWR